MTTRRRSTTVPGDTRADDGERARGPGPLHVLLEARAPLELASLVVAMPWLRRVPRGDGHAVMVFPGMGAGDITTAPLRRFLRGLGYAAETWGQGVNLGPRSGVLERCVDDVQRFADRHGGPVSLVGWSLGGVYAREMAKLHPARTRAVVTLGTPFSGHPKATNAWRLYELLSGHRVGDARLMAHVRRPPPVPTTSIFSRSDGIVAWRCSLNEPGPMTENIEVPSSHVGMGMNPLALYALADRLAQPAGGWRPFDAAGRRRWFFRTAVRVAAR
ncbi:MAG TPA: alpha/beta hydrolase [Caldimonas sp.]|jgi:pimeloyl-ACP methyl ester carboxylesterase|nr:alpha/beta hydrolase [Caldimonas sp.]HEX2543191.1 alpha/beta hydrolase [Caldimonas sp.]